MALFYKQNSAGENPLARRVAQRGGGTYVKKRGRGLVPSCVGSNSTVIILNFTRGLPVYDTQTAEPALAVGFIATNYRHHHHMGKGLEARWGAHTV
jgi:hypothetical protein